MKLSDGVEWGLHCAVVLALIPKQATLTGGALAEFHGVSESYLLKHLKAMAHAGLLQSVPGPKGGYRLAKPANEITVLQVVDAVEGTERAFRCSEIRQRGPACLDPIAFIKPCEINVIMLKAETLWRKELEATTIADIAHQLNGKIDLTESSTRADWFRKNLRGLNP